MENRKTIFLDIDGVLATPRQFSSPNISEELNCYPFDKKCVKVLNEILNKTNARIIITSDWKLHFDIEKLDKFFKFNKVNADITITTDDLWGEYSSLNQLEECRGDEINKFVKENGMENEKWVVVDDLNLKEFLPPNRFVLVKDEFRGLNNKNVKEKIIDILCVLNE